MRTRIKLALLATALLALAIYHLRLSRACSPQAFMPEPIFINTLHPDPQAVTLLANTGLLQPTLSYATGNLGVIQPNYGSVYLFVAYRNLAGWPIRRDELKVLWESGMKQVADQPISLYRAVQRQASQSGKPQGGENDWESVWFSVVGQLEHGLPVPSKFLIPGSEPGPVIYRQTFSKLSGWMSYGQFPNCQQDAFREAVSTYKRLAGQFGESSPVVKNWITAQQMVFGNCYEGDAVPSPLPSTAPAIARKARAYQIAAAYFYSGGYDQSVADFRAIAKDSSSPWSTIAPYLVARSLVRKATMVGKPGPDLAALAQAESEVEAILSNPRYAKYDHAAKQLRGFIEFRLHPRQRVVKLADNMTKFSGDPNFRQDVTDFKLLFPRVAESGSYWGPPPMLRSDVYLKLADIRAKSDLLDWMSTLRLGGPEAYAHSFEKWQRTHSQAWLVAALMNAATHSPHLAELEAAADHIPPISKAYDSVTFHTLRLLVLQGREGEARERLARLHIREMGYPSGPTPPSTVNLFLALGFQLASNLDELFKNAPRIPATITSGNSSQEMPEPIWESSGENDFDPSAARLDDDAVMVFNRFLPVALVAKAVRSTGIPENLRREIALAVWTRAALLGNAAVARSVAPAVETFAPELTASIQSYNSAKTPAARRFAAVFTMLKFPGLRPFFTTLNRETPIEEIDAYRDNWWGTEGPLCAPPNPYNGQPGYPPRPQWPQIGRALVAIYPGGKVKPPAFLTKKEQTEAAEEWQRLLKMGPAPNYLSTQTLAWAKVHPSDPRVPEALALAVKSTRFGCANTATGEFSKAAFDLLHGRYPRSSWAENTKYWFKM